jgi:hypothetical protein
VEIQIFRLGFIADVDLQAATRLINQSQNVFRATVGDPINNIGDPDLFSGMGYSDERLFNLFPPARTSIVRVGSGFSAA